MVQGWFVSSNNRYFSRLYKDFCCYLFWGYYFWRNLLLSFLVFFFVAGIVLCNFRKSFYNISRSFLRLPKNEDILGVLEKKQKRRNYFIIKKPKERKARNAKDNVINKFPFLWIHFSFLFGWLLYSYEGTGLMAGGIITLFFAFVFLMTA